MVDNVINTRVNQERFSRLQAPTEPLQGDTAPEDSVDLQILAQTFGASFSSQRVDAEPSAGASSGVPLASVAGLVAVEHEEIQIQRGTIRVQSNPDAEPIEGFRLASRFEQNQFQQTQLSSQQNRLQVTGQADDQVERVDPLILDLDGDGIETSGINKAVNFDIDGDGRTDQTSFATGGDAFLALDRNQNGQIDDGTELFGDQRGHQNGFAALAELDSNGDQVIDEQDEQFSRLELISVRDDGSMARVSLAEQGIKRLNLEHQQVDMALNAYDKVSELGSFEDQDGNQGVMADVLVAAKLDAKA